MNTRAHCFEFRIGVEGEAAAAAALHRTRHDMIRLKAAMSDLEAHHKAGDYSFEMDFAFHLAVAQAAHNPYFPRSLETLRPVIRQGMLLAISPSGLAPEQKGAAIREQHRDIYRGIVRGDDTGARLAMRRHLLRCHQSTMHWDGAEVETGLEEQGY
ncbi:FCD domain-containing protein [Roseicyclus sp. F158]|uniref:FCD domain-containing protein n=1 Tax=Tropicimonas omnivorans TaxID=3075590 RepID=A0ABU3DF33_9RHOB|nr:FCD domain-containing protein [Roseicyclus sp. F158]MDT0682321.1 FCD domain-containing protein [Roseicyclus sp. F158]